jgi:hypothetical protein
MPAQRLFERLGLKSDQVALEARIQRVTATKDREFRPEDVWMQKINLVERQHSAALACYMAGELAECATRANEVVQLATDYFFGAWRESPRPGEGEGNPEYWLQLDWVDAFRDAVLWSSYLGDWTAARRLADYPSDRTADVSQRKSDGPWYRALAEFIKASEAGRAPVVVAVAEEAADAEVAESDEPREGSYVVAPAPGEIREAQAAGRSPAGARDA